MKNVLFEVKQEYYWPAMKPLYDLMSLDKDYNVSVRVGPNHQRLFKTFLISRKREIENYLLEYGVNIANDTHGYDAVVCCDTLDHPEEFDDAKFFNVEHAISIKTQRLRKLKKQDKRYVRFIEGKYREDLFKKNGLWERHDHHEVGFCKLDPLFYFKGLDTVINYYLRLDPNKKNVLYAPSYKPNSIYDLARELLKLKDYNVMIKLHPYFWNAKYVSSKYISHIKKVIKNQPNIRLIPSTAVDILPFLKIADTVISEGSSVMNEFLILNKSGIIYNPSGKKSFHSDGEPVLSEDIESWLPSFVHFNNKEDLKQAVREALTRSKEKNDELKKDKSYLYSYNDGKSSYRVKKIIDDYIK